MRHVLVVANRTLVGAHITSRLLELTNTEPLDVRVVVPAASSEELDPMTAGLANLDAGLDAIRRLGLTATGTVGHSDPMKAIDRELSLRPAINLVLLSTLPQGPSRWLNMDLPHRVQKRYDVAVEHLIGASLDATTDSRAPGRPVKVLLVEDNEADIELATIALESLPADVQLIVTRTGAGAVQYLAEASPKPDLILADLKMPVMDGHTMMESFATKLGLDTLNELNVVVVSSSAADVDRDRAHALGARAYIVKDPDFANFQATLGSLVSEVDA